MGTDIQPFGVTGNCLFAMVASVAEVVPRFEFWISQPGGQRDLTCPSLITRSQTSTHGDDACAGVESSNCIMSCRDGLQRQGPPLAVATPGARMRREYPGDIWKTSEVLFFLFGAELLLAGTRPAVDSSKPKQIRHWIQTRMNCDGCAQHRFV